MKILSVDTSSKFCSVSILLPDNTIDSIDSNNSLSHSAELAVNTKKILDKYKIAVKDLDYIVVNIGPGSFTGLRIGISFVKGLALSNNIPLIPISSFVIMETKINKSRGSFYLSIPSHKNYAYTQKYNNGSRVGRPKLIDLNKKINIPIYIASDKKYSIKNDIRYIRFTSLDLIELVNNNKIEVSSDINSVKPIYIDYINEE